MFPSEGEEALALFWVTSHEKFCSYHRRLKDVLTVEWAKALPNFDLLWFWYCGNALKFRRFVAVPCIFWSHYLSSLLYNEYLRCGWVDADLKNQCYGSGRTRSASCYTFITVHIIPAGYVNNGFVSVLRSYNALNGRDLYDSKLYKRCVITIMQSYDDYDTLPSSPFDRYRILYSSVARYDNLSPVSALPPPCGNFTRHVALNDPPTYDVIIQHQRLVANRWAGSLQLRPSGYRMPHETPSSDGAKETTLSIRLERILSLKCMSFTISFQTSKNHARQ
jgi:hypothetical protein